MEHNFIQEYSKTRFYRVLFFLMFSKKNPNSRELPLKQLWHNPKASYSKIAQLYYRMSWFHRGSRLFLLVMNLGLIYCLFSFMILAVRIHKQWNKKSCLLQAKLIWASLGKLQFFKVKVEYLFHLKSFCVG